MMGEMADMALDTIIDNMINPKSEEYDPDELTHVVFNRDIQCRYCKRRGFYWNQEANLKWRLYTRSGKLHRCKDFGKKRR